MNPTENQARAKRTFPFILAWILYLVAMFAPSSEMSCCSPGIVAGWHCVVYAFVAPAALLDGSEWEKYDRLFHSLYWMPATLMLLSPLLWKPRPRRRIRNLLVLLGAVCSAVLVVAFPFLPWIDRPILHWGAYVWMASHVVLAGAIAREFALTRIQAEGDAATPVPTTS